MKEDIKSSIALGSDSPLAEGQIVSGALFNERQSIGDLAEGQ